MTKTGIETFTPEQIAVIAADSDRVPSANDLFVRYDDHAAAVREAAGPHPPLLLPPANAPSRQEEEDPSMAVRLEKAGYSRSSRKGALRSGEGSFVALWQKRIEDAVGTRYFVNFTEYDPGFRSGEDRAHVFEAEVQFRLARGGYSNISHSVDDWALDDIQDYFECLWLTGFYHYYEKFESGEETE
jgi:hypothetical protein